MTAHTPPPPVPENRAATEADYERAEKYATMLDDGTPEQQQAARRELIAAAEREKLRSVK